MKNNKIKKNFNLDIVTSHKRITLDILQRIFLDIAQKECDEMLLSFRGKIAENYTNRLDALESDLFSLFDGYTQWKREIKDGHILRILKYVGAYDGDKIDKDRLLTALRVICFIGHFSDDRNGEILSFKGGSLMLPYDDISRLERLVRTAV
jgi:hypothetical protein